MSGDSVIDISLSKKVIVVKGEPLKKTFHVKVRVFRV